MFSIFVYFIKASGSIYVGISMCICVHASMYILYIISRVLLLSALFLIIHVFIYSLFYFIHSFIFLYIFIYLLILLYFYLFFFLLLFFFFLYLFGEGKRGWEGEQGEKFALWHVIVTHWLICCNLFIQRNVHPLICLSACLLSPALGSTSAALSTTRADSVAKPARTGSQDQMWQG